MRRARIKVMATVPARRKPIRDLKEEASDVTKTVSIEANKDQADIRSASLDSSLEPSVVETPKTATENNEKVELSPVQSTKQQQTVDKPAIIEPNPVESLEKTTQPPENTLTESCSPHKRIVVPDNTQTSAPHDIKAVSTNVNTPSPTKTSQIRTSFMRPTPRLDGGGRMRRNSVQGSGASASESEDDSRRGTTGISNHVRNDSVSSAHTSKGRSQSTAANSADTTIDGNFVARSHGPTNSLTSTARQKRKMVVSESARKLAESRREFLLKHEHKQPDKTKLIMYDLIYYNPVTNPMKKSDSLTATSTQRTSSSVITAETDDEDEDDEPSEAMPVPQVKVGPDGSLVIDEQSLVIEHTGAKKSRQAMARTEALVDEDGNGSGFYKKRQKSKDWPEWETLKFYKALNTVGTDFSLIQSLFPQRTRQEIKFKFKKEEKINPRLVEKALANHQEFDMDSLKEDLATFEESIKRQSELEKTENRSTGRQRGKKRKNVKSRRMAAASISEMNDSVGEPNCSIAGSICGDDEAQEVASNGEQKKNMRRRSVLNDSRSASVSSLNESGSDTEIYQVKPTRSGRHPKIRKLQAPMIDDNTCSDDEDDDGDRINQNSPIPDMEQNNISLNSKGNEKRICVGDPAWKSHAFQNSLSGISEVEPGSLVIVSRESADDPGETVLQVYMVSSDMNDGDGNSLRQNMTPVVLTPELLNTVTAGITKVTPIDVKPE